MEKEFVPYELAVKLKELGFDEPCLGFYNHQGQLILMAQEDESSIEMYKNSYVEMGMQYAAPLFQQVFRWFRKKYSWQHSIDATSDQHSFELGYNYWIWNNKTGEEYHTMPKNRPTGDWEYETHEEAELECLEKLIEIIENETKSNIN